MWYQVMVTGAAVGVGAASDGLAATVGATVGAAVGATDGAADGATDGAGVLVAPLEQALNSSAITASAPTSRKRVVTP